MDTGGEARVGASTEDIQSWCQTEVRHAEEDRERSPPLLLLWSLSYTHSHTHTLTMLTVVDAVLDSLAD